MQMATAIASAIAVGAKVFWEFSNEMWNDILNQADYLRNRGLELALSDNSFHAQILFYSQRSVEVMQILEAAFGGTDKLVRVMGSQAANAWVSDQILTFDDAAAYIDALAIAPYFGGYLGNPQERTRVASMSQDDLMTELADLALPQAANWVVNTATVAHSHGVRLISYEAEQHLAGHGKVENDEAIYGLFDNNRLMQSARSRGQVSTQQPIRPVRAQPDHQSLIGDHRPSVVVPVLVLAADRPVDLDQFFDGRVSRCSGHGRELDRSLNDHVRPERSDIDLERRPRLAPEVCILRPVRRRRNADHSVRPHHVADIRQLRKAVTAADRGQDRLVGGTDLRHRSLKLHDRNNRDPKPAYSIDGALPPRR